MRTIVLMLATVALAAATGPAWASQGSHDVDLCNGTGGNGQVVRVGEDGFTLRRADVGGLLIVHLSRGATIRTTAGTGSLVGLDGARVTLVGGPNPDGSFTADTVVVCQANRSRPATHRGDPAQRTGDREPHPVVNAARATTWSSNIDRAALLLVAALWIGALAFLRSRRNAGGLRLLFFTVFYVYLVKVLDLTLFQFQSLLVLKHFAPELMLNGLQPGQKLNLTPLIGLTAEDVRTSLLNVLLMVPFGLGLPFVARVRLGSALATGILFSVAIECLQLITGAIGGVSFRIADVNDVIFNTVGVAVGYGLLVALRPVFRRLPGTWKAEPIAPCGAEQAPVSEIRK